jgi:hypothetical protein
VGNLQDAQNNYHNFPFDGSIRDVAIYKRALSQSEILTNFFNSEPSITVPDPDLLYYRMTETNTTSVPVYFSNSASEGSTNGTYLCNASEIWSNGPAGPNTALHFDGVSAKLDTQLSAPFNFTTNSFTINVWVLPLTQTRFIMANDTYLSSGWFLCFSDIYQIRFGAETPGAEHAVTTGIIDGWPGTSWSMVTVTRDGSDTPLIYINGQLTSTSGSFIDPASSSNNLMFGYGADQDSSSHGPYYLDGNIWLPQVWSTALSPSDIANLYYNQSLGSAWPR